MSPSAEQAAGAPTEISTPRQRVLLWLILAVGFGLRSFRLAWGLPHFIFNDSRLYFVNPAVRAVAQGDWVLERFTHPPVYPYFLSALADIWFGLSGHEVRLEGPGAVADLAQIALMQRAITVVLATATIAAVYLLARRLLGTRGALWAAVFFALCPIHIVESHRVNADTPMLLFAVLSAHQAVVALQRRNRSHLWASFALASLAGACKYSGLFAGTLPIWVALRWPRANWSERSAMIARGGIVSLVAFIVFMSPVALAWDRFATNVADLFYMVFFIGSPGKDLAGDSWVYAPYLYLIFVGLPFLLGWPVFLAAIAGNAAMASGSLKNRYAGENEDFGVLARRGSGGKVVTFVEDSATPAGRQKTICSACPVFQRAARERRQAFSLLAAAWVPFFLVQGGAETATTRYYLPLAPYLAVSAAAAVRWLQDRHEIAARAVGAVIVVYSLLFACSQASRIGGAAQAATGAVIDELAAAKRTRAATAPGQARLVVAYPSWAAVTYDAIWPHVETRKTRLRFFPRSLRSSAGAAEPEAVREEIREWIEKKRVDVIIITSSWENLGRRHSFTPREEIFYRSLVGGELGMRKVADESTRFFTQSWYDWADPTLDTLWTAGIGGYKLYARDSLAAQWRLAVRRSAS